MQHAAGVILNVGREFGSTFGTEYGLFLPYQLQDADVAIVVLGSTGGTAQKVVDDLRAEGRKAGLLKLRTFRPFPEAEIAANLSSVKAIAVLDRSDSFNAVGGPVYNDVRAALYGKTDVPVVNYIYGLGGRDISLSNIRKVYDDLFGIVNTGKTAQPLTYLGVRE
jgi:pyruvate ferredoxin oxidoreductase alpha subunit